MTTLLERDREIARRAWTAACADFAKAASAFHLAAFDAWWAAEHPPDAPIADDAASWWHGCWLEPGHHLWTRDGRSAYGSPLEARRLDGGYAPRRHRGTGEIVLLAKEDQREIARHSDELPQGQFARSLVMPVVDDTYTILSWWDRTQGDIRPNCNSCFIVRGTHTSEAMIAAFPRHFPKQAARLAAAGVALVEAR